MHYPGAKRQWHAVCVLDKTRAARSPYQPVLDSVVPYVGEERAASPIWPSMRHMCVPSIGGGFAGYGGYTGDRALNWSMGYKRGPQLVDGLHSVAPVPIPPWGYRGNVKQGLPGRLSRVPPVPRGHTREQGVQGVQADMGGPARGMACKTRATLGSPSTPGGRSWVTGCSNTPVPVSPPYREGRGVTDPKGNTGGIPREYNPPPAVDPPPPVLGGHTGSREARLGPGCLPLAP